MSLGDISALVAQLDKPVQDFTPPAPLQLGAEDIDRTLFRFAGIPSFIVNAPAQFLGFSKPLDSEYIPFTSVIPTFSVGSALGIEDPLTRTATDIVADPFLWLRGPGLLEKGYAAIAAKTVSSEKKLAELAKLEKVEALIKADPARGAHLLEAARRGDIATLTQYRKYIEDDSALSRRFFMGDTGRGIKDAMDAVEAGKPETLQAGAAASAAAGQRAVLRLGAPIPGVHLNVPLLRGDKLYQFLEDGLKIGWFKKWGTKTIDQMHSTLLSVSAAERGADLTHELANTLEEIRPQLKGSPKARKAVEVSLDNVRASLGNLNSKLTDYQLEENALDASDSALSAVERTTSRGEAILSRTASLKKDIDAIRAGLAKGEDVQHASTFLDVRRRLGSWMLRVGQIAQRDVPNRQEFITNTSKTAQSILNQLPKEALGKVPTLDIEPLRQVLTQFQADTAAVGAGLNTGIDLSSDLLSRSRMEKTAADWGATDLFAAVPSNVPGATQTDRWYLAGRNLVRAYTDMIPSFLEAMDAVAKSKKSGRFGVQFRTMQELLTQIAGGLQHADPEAGLAFMTAVRSRFKGAAPLAPIDVAVNRDAAALGDDVVAAINPLHSTDFGGPGRALPGMMGRGFNAAGIAESAHSTLKNINNRIGAFLGSFKTVFASMRGEAPKLPRGFITRPDELDPAFRGLSDFYHVSTSAGRDLATNTVQPTRNARVPIPASAPLITQLTSTDAQALSAAYGSAAELADQSLKRVGGTGIRSVLGSDFLMNEARTPSLGSAEQAAAVVANHPNVSKVDTFIADGAGPDVMYRLRHKQPPEAIRAQFPGAFVTQDEALLFDNPALDKAALRQFVTDNAITLEEFHGRHIVTEPGATHLAGRIIPASPDAIRAYYDTAAGGRSRLKSFPNARSVAHAQFGDTVLADIPAGAERAPGGTIRVRPDPGSPTDSARIRLTQHDLLAEDQAGNLHLITGRKELHRHLDFVHKEPWLEESARLSPVELPDPDRIQRTELYLTQEMAERRAAQYQMYAQVARGLGTRDEIIARVADLHSLAEDGPEMRQATQGLFLPKGKTPAARAASMFRDLDTLNARLAKEEMTIGETLRAPATREEMAKIAAKDIQALPVAVRGDSGRFHSVLREHVISLPTEDIVPRLINAGEGNRIDVMMEALEDPTHLATLTPSEQGLTGSVAKVLDDLGNLQHGAWFDQFVRDYAPIIMRRTGQTSEVEFARYLTSIRNAGSRSKNMKQRLTSSWKAMRALETRGLVKLEHDPHRVLEAYLRGFARTAVNQQILDILKRSRAMDGAPALIAAGPSGVGALSKILPGANREDALRKYMGFSTRKFPVMSKYRLHRDYSFITKIWGPQTISEAINEMNPGWVRALFRANMMAKGAALSMSLFHYVALHQTLLASVGPAKFGQFLLEEFRRSNLVRRLWSGAADANAAVRASGFANIWGEAGQLIEYAVAHGMELDPIERVASKEFASLVDRTLEAVKNQKPGTYVNRFAKILVSPITGVKHVNEWSNRLTWEIMHNSGKTLVFQEYLGRLMKEFPTEPIGKLAQQAASSANARMGGLNWSKIFGDHRIPTYLQAIMLAPDWTLSHLMSARDVLIGLKGGSLPRDAQGRASLPLADVTHPAGAAKLARSFWANAIGYSLLTKNAINYALNGHTTFSNPGDPLNRLEVFTGRYDPTNGQPIMIETGKQFLEPFKLALEPGKYIENKKSILLDTFGAIITQRDHFGRSITTDQDSMMTKVLKQAGYISDQMVPIPLRNVLNPQHENSLRSIYQLLKGQSTDPAVDILDSISPLLAAIDLNVRRGKLVVPINNPHAIPSTIDFRLLPPDDFGVTHDSLNHFPRLRALGIPGGIR